jgi:hypothetical protein
MKNKLGEINKDITGIIIPMLTDSAIDNIKVEKKQIAKNNFVFLLYKLNIYDTIIILKIKFS